MTVTPRPSRLSRHEAEQIATGATQARGPLGALLAAAAAPANGALPGEDAAVVAFLVHASAASGAQPVRDPARRRFHMPVRIVVAMATLTLVVTAGVGVAVTTGVLPALAPGHPSSGRGTTAGAVPGGDVPRTAPTPGASAPGTPAPAQSGPPGATAPPSSYPTDLAPLCRKYLRGHPPASNHVYAPLQAIAGTDVTGYCQALLATIDSPTPSASGEPSGQPSKSPGNGHGKGHSKS